MAVQIRWKLLRLDLTSLEFSISRGLFQNQIHHGGTEGTEKYFSIWRAEGSESFSEEVPAKSKAFYTFK
jgi:hypothetical protein